MLRHAFVALCITLLLVASVASADGTKSTPQPVVAASSAEPTFSDIASDPRKPEISLVAGRRILQGYRDGRFRPNATVSERDFAGIMDRLLVACPSMAKPSFELKKPDQAMTRIRAVMVVIRAAADKDAMEITDPKAVLFKFSDYEKIPDWGRNYAAFAVDRGYMRVESQFRPMDSITRSELAEVLARCLPPSVVQPVAPETKFTGLIIDCRGIGVARSMSPGLVSEDGTKIYPDLKHLPSIDFIEDQGLVSYVSDIVDSKRGGERPFVVSAVKADGTANQVAIVSDADRDAIFSAENECHFFANWNVTFLLDPK